MRIAFDYQVFTIQSYGGASRYFTRLAQEFISADEEVKIFAPFHINSYVKELNADMVVGKKLKWFPKNTTRLFSTYNKFVARNQIIQWRPDVLHETYYTSSPSESKICPSVITVHDMIHELFSHEFSWRDNTARNKKNAIFRADHLICVSTNTKKDLMKFFDIPESRISVVLHGFDHFSVDASITENLCVRNKSYLLYVGSRGGYKNFSGFLRAVAISKRLCSDFDVVAFGGGRFSSGELALIASLGFNENQVRQVSGDDVLLGNYYSAASAFVYPSLYEGFGIPPLEAMAHHCPVINSSTSSMPEVVGNAGQYFNPSEPEEIRQAIESVVYSDTRSAELKALGIERLNHFSWEKCAQETLAVYRSLV